MLKLKKSANIKNKVQKNHANIGENTKNMKINQCRILKTKVDQNMMLMIVTQNTHQSQSKNKNLE